METTAALHPSLTTLQFNTRFLHFSFSHSFPGTSKLNLPFQSSLSTSLRSQFLSLSFPSPRNSLSANCSFADESTSSTKVATVDSVARLEVLIQKKAMDISPDLKGTSVFLLGMNNSIKSSLGKLLADSLRYYYFDSDALVSEAAGGVSAARLFRESDEKGFRESETEVLKQLSSMGRLVVCAGDGAVQSSTNLALLRHGISIWIDVPLDIITKGVIENKSEIPFTEIPSSGSYSEVLSQLTALYAKASRGYATADATVSLQKVASQLGYDDFDAVTTEDMTIEVLKELERLTRVKKMMEEAARPF